ncbi:hypothetical protein ACSVC9_01225 [Clostridium sp. LBM24168]
MRYIISFLIIAANYYTFSYGVFMYKNENNRLGAFGAYIISMGVSIISIIILFVKW